MNNADMPAIPVAEPVFQIWVNPKNTGEGTEECLGLTKREHFAAMAMQAMLTNAGRNGFDYENPGVLTDEAVNMADSLLKSLEEQQ